MVILRNFVLEMKWKYDLSFQQFFANYDYSPIKGEYSENYNMSLLTTLNWIKQNWIVTVYLFHHSKSDIISITNLKLSIADWNWS